DVVCATPAHVAAGLLAPFLDDNSAEHLASLPHPFVATVGLGFQSRDIEHPLDAFGLLVASESRLPPPCDVLGILFPSTIFPARAPRDAATLSVMIGGARDPEAASLDDQALVERAANAVRHMLGGRAQPTISSVARWERAIPQYRPGHENATAELRRALREMAGPHVVGNYLDGVGVEATIASAERAVAEMLDPDNERPPT
ncbi:MAG: protoporphyrinogen oxidase, partial [Acidobacteriota bacterium]